VYFVRLVASAPIISPLKYLKIFFIIILSARGRLQIIAGKGNGQYF
jgi:hypothetical protein